MAQRSGLRGVSGRPTAHNTVGIQFSKVSNILGAADVKEAFGETLRPADRQARFQRPRSTGAAAGPTTPARGTIWAYKGGLEADIADTFRLRGTYSRDVRAGKPFGAVRQDRRRGDSDRSAQPARQQPCERQPGLQRSRSSPAAIPTSSRRRPTPGPLAWYSNPAFLPGLSASVDWYDIKIKDAIGQVGTQSSRQSLPRNGAGAGILQPDHAQQRQSRPRAGR